MSLNNIQDQLLATVSRFDKELENYPYLKKLEAQSGIPKAYGSLGFVAFYLLLIFANVGGIGQLLANIVTLVIPGYYSLLALETRGSSDDTHYLTYWVVYAAFSVVEFWSKTILYWVPFYWFFKTIAFLYLGLPQYSGARWVYVNVLRPFSRSVGIYPGGSSSLKEQVNAAAEEVGNSTGVSHH